MTPVLIEHLNNWIGNNTQVVDLPISKDTLLVTDIKRPGKKIRVSKLLCRISISDLHNDLISENSIYQLKEEIDESTWKPPISDTPPCALIPNNFQKMKDRYKQMCGCKISVIIFSMQAPLNRYWLEHLNLLREQARDKGVNISH